MGSSSMLLMVLAGMTTGVGLVPCLGWMNWFAVPLSLACATVGVVGLVQDRENAGGPQRNVTLHTTALVVGVVLASVGSLRFLVGGGFL